MTSISIILTAYNAEKHIDRCLNSLVTQTFLDIEMIAVNDGSTDRTLDLLNKYASIDNRIIIINQDNLGLEVSRSNALAKTRGKYIMFCDADDWYEPEMCNKMFTTIEESGTDLVICKTSVRREIETFRLYKSKYYDFEESGIYDINLDTISKINSVLWNKIFRSKIIKNKNMDFPKIKNIRVGWDAFFVMEYMLHSKNILFLEEYLYNYRLHGESLMDDIYKGVSKSTSDIWNNLEEFYNILISKNLLNDDVMKFFLNKYKTKTIYYFKFLKSDELKKSAIETSKVFLDKIQKDSNIVKNFKEEYIKELIRIYNDKP